MHLLFSVIIDPPLIRQVSPLPGAYSRPALIREPAVLRDSTVYKGPGHIIISDMLGGASIEEGLLLEVGHRYFTHRDHTPGFYMARTPQNSTAKNGSENVKELCNTKLPK